MDKLFAAGARVAFIGDSITHNGRAVAYIQDYYRTHFPEREVRIYNHGIAGDTAAGASCRLDEVMSVQPTEAVVMFGVNDMGVGYYERETPSEEHLRSTHRPFFETVRKMQPELPIILMTHVWSFEDRETDFNRVKIVKETYDAAIAAGDKNVYFIDGSNFFRGQMRDLCTVDALHPNDLGQFIMAKEVYKTLAMALKR